MNDIQKFYHDRMIEALYAAQAELMANIKSKDSHSYFRFETNDTLLSTEIFNSFKELEVFVNDSADQFQSVVPTSLKYTSLHAREFAKMHLFDASNPSNE